MVSLCIDTSNQPISVALVQEGAVLNVHTSNVKRNHSLQLMPIIEQLISEAKLTPQHISEVIVAEGPGSYTGLRIGVTTAKTLAYTLNCELYGVSSLKVLAATTKQPECYIVPIIDARRQYVYTGVYKWSDKELMTIMEDQYIALEDLLSHIQSYDNVIFVGQDTQHFDELKSYSQQPNLPQADRMVNIKGTPSAVHSFTPQYLKLSEAEQNWLDKQQSKND